MGYTHHCKHDLCANTDTDMRWAAFLYDVAKLSRALNAARQEGYDMGRVIIHKGARSVEVNGGYEEDGSDNDDMTVEVLDVDIDDMLLVSGRGYFFCKTNRMNYDTAVVVVLFLLRHHFGENDQIVINTDASTIEELDDAVFLYRRVFPARNDADELANHMLDFKV